MESLHPPGSTVSADELEELEEIVQDELPAYLEDLATLVNVDCGSYTKAGVDQVGSWTAAFLERLGAQVEIHAHPTLGDTVVGTFRGRPGAPRALLIGHLDTVFPEGTAAERPLRIDAGIARGPGVTDMKSGLLAGLYAILAMLSLGEGEDLSSSAAGKSGSSCRSSASCSWPIRTRRSARSRAPPSSASWPSPRTSASSSSAPGPTATSSRRARAPSTSG